jgi:hypothetical protein
MHQYLKFYPYVVRLPNTAGGPDTASVIKHFSFQRFPENG